MASRNTPAVSPRPLEREFSRTRAAVSRPAGLPLWAEDRDIGGFGRGDMRVDGSSSIDGLLRVDGWRASRRAGNDPRSSRLGTDPIERTRLLRAPLARREHSLTRNGKSPARDANGQSLGLGRRGRIGRRGVMAPG